MGQHLPERLGAGLRLAGALLVLSLAPLTAAHASSRASCGTKIPSSPEDAASLQHEVEPAVAEIQRVLRRARDPQGPPAEEAALELEPWARAGLPLLIEILRDRKVPALEDARAQTLSEIQEAIVMRTLAGLDRAAVLAQTQQMLARGRTLASRDATIRVLGSVGRALDVPTLFDLPLAPDEPEIADRLAISFRAAVAGMLQRDPEVLLQIDRLWSYQREPLLLPLLEGLGDARDNRSLELLDEILVRHEHHLVPVLTQIRRIGPSTSLDVNDQLARRLRHHLDPSRPGCRAAVFALATLRDYDSVPALIDLLEHESGGLARDAYHALRELTGLELRADAQLWDSWYLAEMAWIDDHAPRVLAQLHSPRHSDIAAAIGELARRRLFNDTWALELAPLLIHGAPTVRSLSARALAALRSPYVVEALIEVLDDASGDVKAAAHRALRATTRLNLAPEAALWRAALLDTRT